MPEAKPLAEIVGGLVRRRREEFGLRQDDVALRLRDLGLPWRRSTVASFELGRRRLDLDEVWLVCVALDVSLAELLEGGDSDERVAHPGGWSSFRIVRSALTGQALMEPEGIRTLASRRVTVVLDETTRRAAKALGVGPSAVIEASERLWGRSLPEERDLRISLERNDEVDTPRTMQALRGWVTRQLMAELRSEVSR